MDDKRAETNLEQATRAFFSENTAGESNSESALIYALSGPLHGRSFVLDSDFISIGREIKSTIRLPSDAVSRLHCQLVRSDSGNFSILDNDSMNGTVVNGRKLEAQQALPLTHGDNISICGSMFLFIHPPLGSAKSGQESISVDLAAAQVEADKLLKGCDQFKSLRRTRARK
ncbi:MAG: FHA domain-containing protein [Pirellulaceae bacterium]|nr:FHA domain-containing protein [Pirellulaceae bacterium]